MAAVSVARRLRHVELRDVQGKVELGVRCGGKGNVVEGGSKRRGL